MKNILFLCILAIITIKVIAEPEDIILNLERSQLDTTWHANSDQYGEVICNTYQDSKKSFEKVIKSPQKCDNNINFSKLKQNCVQNNLYYKTDVIIGDKKNKKNLKLHIDLMSPWTWVKGYGCKQFSRDGTEIKSENCVTGNEEENEQYKSTFTCLKENHCSQVKKCAELDYQSEGLSVIGKFADTRLKFKNMLEEDYGIKDQRIIMAYALSGQQSLQADGVLGLGKPQKEIVLNDLSSINMDDLKQYSDELENDQEDYSQDLQDSLSQQSQNPFDFMTFDSEPNTSVIKNIQNDRFSELTDQIFSVYIADSYEFYNDDAFKPHIQLGGMNPEKFVVNYNHNQLYRMSQVKLHHEKYYLWQVPIQSISIFKDAENKPFLEIVKHGQYTHQETVDNFEKPGILSLSTTNLVLPSDQLKKLRDILAEHYSYHCVFDKKYLYNVYCKDLDSPANFTGIYITINFTDKERVVINPNDLVQSCQQQQDDKYECILNLQRSYNDHTILGEAVMKNYYWVFDTDEEQIEFAPAKNKYNEDVFKVLEEQITQELKDIVQDIEYDVEFIIRFSSIIFLVVVAVLSFKNVNAIIKCLYKCLGQQERVRIQPQETEDFIDLKQQQENEQRAKEKEKNNFENKNLDEQFVDFDTQQINQQKQSILDSSKQQLNNPFDSDEEDQQQHDIDDLDNGI